MSPSSDFPNPLSTEIPDRPKQSTNTQIRREVVGQMMDYAANAVQYWPIQTLRDWFETTCQENGVDPTDELTKVISDTSQETIEQFWAQVEANLRQGRMRLVFAADSIPPELKRIIEFLDEHMTPTQVIGVEIRQYVGKGVRTLVPSVVRSNQKAEEKKKTQWSLASFNEPLMHKGMADILPPIAKVLNFGESESGWFVTWGQGKSTGSFSLSVKHGKVNYPVVSLWTTGEVQFQFGSLLSRDVPMPIIEKFAGQVNEITAQKIPKDRLAMFPSIKIECLKSDAALAIFLNALGEIAAYITQDKTAVAGV